jgi:hypothetical protein
VLLANHVLKHSPCQKIDVMRGWDVPKGSSAFKKGKALKGESHGRWGMKQDLKVAARAKRQDGNQTVNASSFQDEANPDSQSRLIPIRRRDPNLMGVTSFANA